MSSDLRVGLHVGQLRQGVPGGIGRVTQMLADALPRHVALTPFPRRVRRRLPSPSLGYACWHAFRRPMPRIDVDIVHAPSLAIPPHSAPLVVSIHDLAFLRIPEAFTPHGRRFHERGLAIARAEAAAIIVPSEFTRDELLAEGFEPERIHLAPLASALSAAAASESHDQAASRRPYVLVAGTIEPRKCHAVVVAGFERAREHVDGLELIIAGRVGWMSSHALDALRRPGVRIVTQPSDGQLAALYGHASAVVNMSRYEGFGLTTLEALAAGRPTIASDIPPHREVAGSAAELIAPGDVDALAEAIVAAVLDREYSATLSQAGRERAQTFTVDGMIAAHLDVYRAITSTREHR